jgi:nucleotide-binding universal stress UspA family protein
MKAFRKILVPVDFEEASMEALSQAAILAMLSGADLHIAHVVDDILGRYAEFPFAAAGQIQVDLTEAAEQRLGNLAQRPDLQALKPRPVMLTSTDSAEAILRHADEEGVDLIVMGTHGRTTVMRLLLGSVAERVVRGAHCPVMVVRAPVAPRYFAARQRDTVAAQA